MNTEKNKAPSGKAILQSVRTALTAADVSLSPIWRTVSMLAVSLTVSGASLFGIAYPFGIALVAAAADALTAAAAAVGCVLGSIGTANFTGNSISAVLLFCARLAVALFLSPTPPKAVGKGGGSDEPLPPIPLMKRGDRMRAILSYDFRQSGVLRPALAATASMASGAISLLLRGTSTVSLLLGVFFSAVITPIVAAACIAVREKRSAAARQAGILLLLFAAARSLSQSDVVPFDLGSLFSFAAPIVITYREVKRGARALSATAVTAGVVLGFATGASGAPIYAAAAIAAGLCMKISPAAAVCGAYLAAMSVSFADGGVASLAAVMPEITCAAALLVPLVHFSLIPCREVSEGENVSYAERAEEARIASVRAKTAISQVESIAAACGDLSAVFGAVSGRLKRPNVLELKEICDSAAAARCASCTNRVLCWEREYATTADTVCRITAALHKDGRVSAAIIPKNLAARCHHMDGILNDVNEQCARRAAEAAKTDRTDVLSDDLSSFSEILTDAAASVKEQFVRDDALSKKLTRALAAHDFAAENVSVYGTRKRHIVARAVDLSATRMGNEEIRRTFEEITGAPLSVPEYEIDGTSVTMTMESRTRLRTQYGAATRAAGEADASPSRRVLNGDAAASFTTADGRYIAVISDGMGTGGEAAVTSRLSVTFLTKMLTAGVSLKNALSMLNNYLRARNMECSAGIDVMELDLYAAEARFVKSGAAPSFVVRDGRLFRLASKTVPIGILRALDAEMIRFTVESGDTVVMLSDGVMSGFEEAAWLCDLLASPHMLAKTPEEIAEKIVAAAATESRDDITAAVIKIR